MWARGPAGEGPKELLPYDGTLADLLGIEGPSLGEVHAGRAVSAVPDGEVRCPLDHQEVWAAGVTYQRSRDERKLESVAPDPYDRIYDADRPELFLKAAPGRVCGPGEPVAIRPDSVWDVPEPELGLVLDEAGTISAYVIGNDMSSRSIEGENPLYLPQAKIYDGSCAIGPCLVPVDEAPSPADMTVTLTVERAGGAVVEDQVAVSMMRRTTEELADWLFRALSFPAGAVLLTGTGIIPNADFTLQAHDLVRIGVTGLGELSNPVRVLDAG